MNERTANQSLDVAFFILGDPFVGYGMFWWSHVGKDFGPTLPRAPEAVPGFRLYLIIINNPRKAKF